MKTYKFIQKNAMMIGYTQIMLIIYYHIYSSKT